MTSGILIVNKPVGLTSQTVCAKIKKKFNIKKIGHTGTLDPLAEGVLVLLIGSATKLQNSLMALEKKYEFYVHFGKETDSGDLEGNILREITDVKIKPHFLSDEGQKKLCEEMKKINSLTAPLHSAIRINGVRAYKMARKGDQVITPEIAERLQRPVQIFDCRILEFSHCGARISVHCSKGTYVRSLAKEFCDKVETFGVVTQLIRTKNGPFLLENTVNLEEALKCDNLEDICLPIPIGRDNFQNEIVQFN